MIKKEWTKAEITFVRNQYKKGNSRFTIAKKFYERFLYRRTPDSIKHCIDVHCSDIELYIPKVLLVDVETKPRKYYAWGPKTEYLAKAMMIEDGAMMSWSAKWIGQSKIYYQDQRGNEKNLTNDKKLMKPLFDLMEQADIIIWQNGDQFDYGIINDRFTEHRMGLPSEYRTIDTKKIACRHLNLPYNSLEYMTGRFNTKYKKQDHKDFPGFTLWEECMAGNRKAWNSMKKYNEYDVLSLEELFVDTLAGLASNSKVVKDAMRAYEATKKK
jgi:DNA polymerase elongation subunit (family B)